MSIDLSQLPLDFVVPNAGESTTNVVWSGRRVSNSLTPPVHRARQSFGWSGPFVGTLGLLHFGIDLRLPRDPIRTADWIRHCRQCNFFPAMHSHQAVAHFSVSYSNGDTTTGTYIEIYRFAASLAPSPLAASLSTAAGWLVAGIILGLGLLRAAMPYPAEVAIS